MLVRGLDLTLFIIPYSRDIEEVQEATNPVPQPAPSVTDAPENEDEVAQDSGPKVLSKKEKEKLKKEREKVCRTSLCILSMSLKTYLPLGEKEGSGSG